MSNFSSLKDTLFGKPLLTAALSESRLRKLKALPILSSDALSSVAYGTEAILRALVLGGAAALAMSLSVAVAICVLILLLGASYWQTIEAYPSGGGAFTVARENLGQGASLLAAAALLIDYLLTVAVSITAGVLAVTSAFPILIPHTILLALITLTFIALVNLRGVRESAAVFALPTYAFIVFVLVLFVALAWHGLSHPILRSLPSLPTQGIESVSVLLILRAFAMGCTALTGVECIANGVPIFKQPEVKNAQLTLIVMIALLGTMFFGVSYFSRTLHLLPSKYESVLSMLAHLGYGHGFFYYGFQVSTALILLLAANTAFTGFPRLAAILSQYKYLPKQLNSLGDRLSFSNGIILLAILSGFLIIIFHGDSNALLPLYSIGVFLAFSLSQLGMVVHWYRLRTKNWQIKFIVNLFGFVTTTIALLVIINTKFSEGAWIVIILIPIFWLMFMKIYRHYGDVDRELAISPAQANQYFHNAQGIRPKVIIPISKIHRGTLAAINFAYSISDDVTAVAIAVEAEKMTSLRTLWDSLDLKIPLVILSSPYRSTIAPLDDYIQTQDLREPERGLCVIVMPTAVTTRWWHNLLHNHRAVLFKASMYYKQQQHKGSTRIFVDVPYQLKF